MKDCAEVQSKWLENLSARNTQKVDFLASFKKYYPTFC